MCRRSLSLSALADDGRSTAVMRLLHNCTLQLLRIVSICCARHAEQMQLSAVKLFCNLLRSVTGAGHFADCGKFTLAVAALFVAIVKYCQISWNTPFARKKTLWHLMVTLTDLLGTISFWLLLFSCYLLLLLCIALLLDFCSTDIVVNEDEYKICSSLQREQFDANFLLFVGLKEVLSILNEEVIKCRVFPTLCYKSSTYFKPLCFSIKCIV